MTEQVQRDKGGSPDRLSLTPSAVRKFTESLLEEVHEWFYERVGGDPEDLYEELADTQGLDLEIEQALGNLSIPVGPEEGGTR